MPKNIQIRVVGIVTNCNRHTRPISATIQIEERQPKPQLVTGGCSFIQLLFQILFNEKGMSIKELIRPNKPLIV